MAKYRVRNSSPAAMALNLSTGGKGSLHLRPREVSRVLAEREFRSPEVQAALRAKALAVVKTGGA